MDTETYSDNEDIPAPSPDEPVFTSSGGGMFAGSQYFTIAGGTFNNIMNAAPTVPRDFRMIPIGDIDLRKELVVNKRSSTIGHGREHNCVRRVYSAKIDGRKSNVAVAMYQGDGAEEDWRRDVEKYMLVRHPNILQICGGASYGNIHATVFHDDLVPLKEFLTPQSPIMTVYLYACHTEEWEQVNNYFESLWRRTLEDRDCTMWIRTSNGRLSVDLVPPDNIFYFYSLSVEASFPPAATPSNITEALAIESLVLAQYHRICSLYLGKYQHDSISTSATVHIGVITSWPSGHQYEEHVEISLLPAEIDVDYSSWWRSGGVKGDLMGNGWTRYRADDVFDTRIVLRVDSLDSSGWLSQANHVFNRLQITSNLEDYVRMVYINFRLTVGNARGDPPPGYLFLCPKEDFRTGATSFRWPNRPAYWSLDPEGSEALSTEEAARLRFPPFQLATIVGGRFWDASVYAGLREFHQAKGFDTDSQDVARYLGCPLYELSPDVNPPFAHVDDFYKAEATAEDVDTDYEWADAQSSLHEDSGSKTWRFPESWQLLPVQPHLGDEGSDVEAGVGEDTIFVEQPAPQVDQKSMDNGYTGMKHQANLKSQTTNDHPTSRGVIHRIFGALRHSLVVEVDSDNIDSDPISPFLV